MAFEEISWSTQRPSSAQITLNRILNFGVFYISLLWWVFFDNHIDELLSVLGDQLEALLVYRSGQTVAEHVQCLLYLCLIGLVLPHDCDFSILLSCSHLDA